MRHKLSNHGRWPAPLSILLSGVLIALAIAAGLVPVSFRLAIEWAPTAAAARPVPSLPAAIGTCDRRNPGLSIGGKEF